MIILISPAKSINSDVKNSSKSSTPFFQEDIFELITELKKTKQSELKKLMHISDALAKLNFERYQKFELKFDKKNARQAIRLFNGDVYQGIDVQTLDGHDLNFAQKHLRILSGLYGLLRPLDLIQEYRLEMGTAFNNKRGKTLYKFWGDKIALKINEDQNFINGKFILNLASNEYFKAVSKEVINSPILNVNFKEIRNGELKFISFNAKKARGYMTRYVIKNRITTKGKLKSFDYAGYQYNDKLSDDWNWIFTREGDMK